MKVRCFLVLGKRGRLASVRRSTQRKPPLNTDEALVALELDVPDDIFDAPLITVPIEHRNVAVAVDADNLLEEGVGEREHD